MRYFLHLTDGSREADNAAARDEDFDPRGQTASRWRLIAGDTRATSPGLRR